MVKVATKIYNKIQRFISMNNQGLIEKSIQYK